MVVLGISVFARTSSGTSLGQAHIAAVATSPLLLVAIAYWIGGYLAINRFVDPAATEGLTTRNAYAGLVLLGLPLTWVAAPLSAIFWIVGCSAVTIGLRALPMPGHG